MFIKNPKVALQSILRSAVEKDNSQPLPKNLDILIDDVTGRLQVDPAEVIAQVHKLGNHALSSDPTL